MVIRNRLVVIILSGLEKKSSFLCLCAVLSVMLCAGAVIAKELPLLVELSEISSHLDGKRITVFGYVRTAEVQTGRRGSLHLALVLGEGDYTVNVYIIRPVPNIINQPVIVQGIYHEQGRFAGRRLDHFIVAETIERDWSRSRSRSQ